MTEDDVFIILLIVVTIITICRRREWTELLLAFVHPNGALPERLLL